jgi:hypothetical protein
MLPLDDPEDGEPVSKPDPELQHAALLVATAIVEVIAGRRNLRQLEQLVSDTALHAIKRLTRAHLGQDLWLLSVHVQSPDAGVAEVAAHLRHCGLSRAAAIRLVRTAKGWMCTRFEAALSPHTITRAG